MGAPQHVIAVIGRATAGAETAALLADQGVAVVVFEQNAPRSRTGCRAGISSYERRSTTPSTRSSIGRGSPSCP
jgi:flavin-dependent dehydrogenase